MRLQKQPLDGDSTTTCLHSVGTVQQLSAHVKVGDHGGEQHFHHTRHQVRSPSDNVLVIRTYFCVNPNYMVVKSDVPDDTPVKNNVLDTRT